MPIKSISAALATAGLIAASTLSDAGSGSVFVPELAAADDAVCRQAPAGNRLLLLLA